MKLKVNPTRQELLRIKKRLKTARSGHALLKEKLDGLMKEFLDNIKELKRAREVLGKKMPNAFFSYFLSNAVSGKEKNRALLEHFPEAEINLSLYSVMGVEMRKIEILNREDIANTKMSLDLADKHLLKARQEIEGAGDDIFHYANLMIKIRLLSEEIERTRRRVNSLEHIYIPEMERVKKYISQKLEERERFDRTVILKLKDMIDQNQG